MPIQPATMIWNIDYIFATLYSTKIAFVVLLQLEYSHIRSGIAQLYKVRSNKSCVQKIRF